MSRIGEAIDKNRIAEAIYEVQGGDEKNKCLIGDTVEDISNLTSGRRRLLKRETSYKRRHSHSVLFFLISHNLTFLTLRLTSRFLCLTTHFQSFLHF